MFERIKRALSQMVTGPDNETHDLGRWSWVVCTASVIGGAVGNWVHGLSIDVQALGAGLSAVAVAHGVALWAKKDTEPQK